MTRYVYAVATMDTKGEELLYLADCLRTARAVVRTVDVSASAQGAATLGDVTREQLLVHDQAVLKADRGTAVTAMGQA